MPLKLEMKSISSPELEYGKEPLEPDNCAVFIEVEIGAKSKEGSDIFSFTAITPKYLSANPVNSWGALLIYYIRHLMTKKFSLKTENHHYFRSTA